MKNSLLALLACWLGVGMAFSQTTITTDHIGDVENGSVTFNVHNTNAYDIIITDVSCLFEDAGTNDVELLYNTTPINDNSYPFDGGTIGDGQNGWVSGGSATLSNTAYGDGVVTAISGMSITIPAGATYAFGFSGTAIYYAGLTDGDGVNTFTADGVDLLTGDGISWGGLTFPDQPENYPRGFVGGITFIPAIPCTSPPTAGTLAASINPVCASVNSVLHATGGTNGTGQTYQWQSSSDNITYTDIASATNSNYTANQTAATWYRLIVTCGGMPDTTDAMQLTMSSFLDCYCTSGIPMYTADEEIYNVTVNGGSTDPAYADANGCSTVAPGPGSILSRYSNFRTLAPITSVIPGQTVSFSIDENECDGSTYYSNGIAIWIDFNQNGSFTDAGEQVYLESSTSQGPRTVTGTFTVPASAVIGNTVMRVMCAENYSGSDLTPCFSYYYGETEDHLFAVQCPTLTGPTAYDAGVCSGNAATLTATPTNGMATISWWDAPTAGTQLSGTSSYTTPALVSTTTYYVQEDFPSCPSSPRVAVDAIISPVDVTLVPVDATCNGLDNGSFTQTAVSCGTAPFEYSLDNGATFGPIPTDLTAGTYMVIVRDASMSVSVAYPVMIAEPSAPTALTVNTVNYFSAEVAWTAEGDESQWTIEYGPAGFTPGAGTTVTATSNPWMITGLSPDTDYEFYVAAGCVTGSDAAGPAGFHTNAGFSTYDNTCGPGFFDISGTGTALNLADDDEADITASFPISFMGVSSDQVTVSNNGWILVGGTLGFDVYSQDFDDSEGNIYYETVTIGGSDYFIVQWDDYAHYEGVPGQTATFEIMISQATGEVFYLYDDAIFGGDQDWADNGGDAFIAASSDDDQFVISEYETTYLSDNSCVHFYNELCPMATNLTQLVFSSDAILDWDAGAYGETNWTLIYGPEGFDPAAVPSQAIDTFQLTSSDASFGGALPQQTTYDVYIYSECQADNLTSGGLFTQFTTLPSCSNPSDITTDTDVDSLEVAWDWTASDPMYDATSYNIVYGAPGFDPYTESLGGGPASGLNLSDTIMNTAFLSGGVYEVYVQAVCSATNDTSLYTGPVTFVMPLTNDGACGAENLMVDGTAYTFNNDDATVDTGESSIAPPADGAQVTTGWTNSTLNHTTWFTFTAPASGSIRINNTAIEYNGQAAVYEVSDCGDFVTFALLAANDNAIGGTSVAPNFTICGLTPGATYYLMNDGFNSATGDYSISISPIVLEAGTANPVTDICTGATVDLFSTVSGEDAGGVWSSSIPAVNASINGSDLTSGGLAYQTFGIQYRVTDGCAYDSIMGQVHIFGPSNAGTDGTITACRNEPVDLLSGLEVNADLNGDWYDPSNTVIASSAITTSNIPGQFNYDYITGNGVCPNDTANVVVTVQNCDYLSIQEEMFNGVSLFPNPSEGLVFITSDVTEAFDYTITDMKGSVVAKANGAIKNGQQNQIDLSKAETGVYFIKLSNTQAQKVFRVVIQ